MQGGGSSFKNIAAATTTLVVSGVGVLRELTINSMAAAATVTVYDGVDASGTKIATIAPAAALNGPLTGLHNINFQKGLAIVTVGVSDITASYN